MNPLVLVIGLQQVNPAVSPPERLGGTSGLILRDVFLIVGVSLVLGLLLVLWARASAQRRKRKRHHSQPGILQNSPEEKEEKEEEGEVSEHRRRRRRRRRRQPQDHPQRNPTLSETGGLPPVRPDPPASPPP